MITTTKVTADAASIANAIYKLIDSQFPADADLESVPFVFISCCQKEFQIHVQNWE